MLKKGQLVRSLNSGCLYYIHWVTPEGRLNVGHVTSRGISLGGYARNSKNLRLIGNNYQPKDINKALREVRAV